MANESTNWVIKNGRLSKNEFFENEAKITDYPNGVWKINEERGLYNDFFPYPYPAGFTFIPKDSFIIKNNKLTKSFFEIEELGAFCHAENLSSVKIPKSVKKIGPYSFTYTSLSEVTIASDCDYSETTFPKDCVINFYSD